MVVERLCGRYYIIFATIIISSPPCMSVVYINRKKRQINTRQTTEKITHIFTTLNDTQQLVKSRSLTFSSC